MASDAMRGQRENHMTPEERDLIADLFGRLAELEREPRDPDAERAIREGLRRAPNAVYALVQTVLVQDGALKAANDHIADLEDRLAEAGRQEPPRSFLGDRRGGKWNTGDVLRGSVPPVRPSDQPMGAPPGYGGDRGGYQAGGYPPGGPMQGGAPMAGGPMGGAGGGGSFLGTAAAVAAGAIGGSLLMGGIRSAMGGHGSGPASGAFDHLAGGKSAGGSPWERAGGSNELSREAGLDDIGGGRRASAADTQNQPTADEQQDFEQDLEDETLDDEDLDVGTDDDTA